MHVFNVTRFCIRTKSDLSCIFSNNEHLDMSYGVFNARILVQGVQDGITQVTILFNSKVQKPSGNNANRDIWHSNVYTGTTNSNFTTTEFVVIHFCIIRTTEVCQGGIYLCKLQLHNCKTACRKCNQTRKVKHMYHNCTTACRNFNQTSKANNMCHNSTTACRNFNQTSKTNNMYHNCTTACRNFNQTSKTNNMCHNSTTACRNFNQTSKLKHMYHNCTTACINSN